MKQLSAKTNDIRVSMGSEIHDRAIYPGDSPDRLIGGIHRWRHDISEIATGEYSVPSRAAGFHAAHPKSQLQKEYN